MQLHNYASNSGKDLIMEYINSLTEEEKVDAENMYLLHACRKQKNKTEKRDKNIVMQRAKELGKLLGKSFI